MVWLSHILIRHRDVRLESVSFAPPDWRASEPLPSRTREQARTLARDLAQRSQRAVGEFSTYAKQYSEDLSTRALGGSLGGISAFELSPWPQILDALSAIGPGEVSDPIETEYGFHVLLKRQPPPEEVVTGAHVVIGYDDARWLHNVLARRAIPERSRDEALAVANNVYQVLRANPNDLPVVIEQYSEHVDAARAGDMGTWSTHEPTAFRKEVEVLQGLRIGEAAAPIDSLVGFQIIMRQPNRPRKEYAMTTLALLFSPSAPEDDSSSRRSVMAEAQELANALALDPSRFDVLQNRYCCKDVLVWRQGSDFPGVEVALEQLEFGEIASVPVETIGQILVPKRLDPGFFPRAPIRLGLP